MTKIDIIKEMLGEDVSDLVADELKQTFIGLKGDHGYNIWSTDKEIEDQKKQELIDALKIVHSWYSTSEIK